MTRQSPSDSNTAPSSPPKQRKLSSGRWRRALVIAGVTLVSMVALLIGLFFYVINTEQGTRFGWRAALILSGGHLNGTLKGGALKTGVQLQKVRWHTKKSDIRFNSLQGQWALSAKPWHLVVDFLKVDTIDLRFAATKNPKKTALPDSLTLPIGFEIRDVQINQIRLHDGASTTELNHLALQAHSDGRHHEITLKRLTTPLGVAHAFVKLDGIRPFPVTGQIGLGAQAHGEEAFLDMHLSGTLASLIADLTASGKKLTGHAHIEALPFSQVPLKVTTLKIEHLNPRAFSASAPIADLSLQAQLQPVQNQTQTNTQTDELIVAGPLTIINQKPGAFDADLLPLLDAHANIRLSEQTQKLDKIRISFLKNLALTGSGTFTNGRGKVDLYADKLDLSVFNQAFRKTQLGGSLTLLLDQQRQQAEIKLSDTQLALRAQTTLTAKAGQTTINSVLHTKDGQATLAGTLKKNIASSYQLEIALERFNPLSFFNKALFTHAKLANRLPSASLSGTLTAHGKLAKPSITTTYALHDSQYGGLPLTGAGTLKFTKKHLLPSDATLSVAGNQLAVHGSFGHAEDRLIFQIDAPRLERLGFNLAGTIQADGDISGTLAHPHVNAHYRARALAFGKHRLASAQGQAELKDGARGALNFTLQANGLATSDIFLKELKLHLTGTRAQHLFSANALGQIRNAPLALSMAAHGSLIDEGEQSRWTGSLTQLINRGLPAVQLTAPTTISIAPQQVKVSTARLSIEKAALNLRKFVYDHGRIQSSGMLTGMDLNRFLQISQLSPQMTAVNTDLVFDSDWDFALDTNASGYFQLKRRAGDIALNKSRGGATVLGVTQLDARLDFTDGHQAQLTAHAKAARLGNLETSLRLPLIFTLEGQPNFTDTLASDAPVAGTIAATVPSLKNTGGLLGPQFILEGQAGLNLTVAGQIGKPIFSGRLTGDNLALSLLDEGVTLKEGVVRIALSDNVITFKQVEFHGASGVLLASGGIQLDHANPAISAQIKAKKLELFATPERQLSLSGQATIANTGEANKLEINGAFTVDRALLDLPATRSPQLGEDVKIVHASNDTQVLASKALSKEEKPASQFLPSTNISIDLGNNFRFHGVGADLNLRGQFTVNSVPEAPLHATGDIRVIEGSTYETFGRKLKIEKGYFTFNGPLDNPGINILAMRRNQAVEVGVTVTGTVRTPQARLISEPNVPDEDKLSWLLFGHGANSGTNLGQQSTMNAAFALLGSTGGKKIAKTIGFDEFSIGQSETGLTDSQVVNVAKAINERFILGYEQGITASVNLFKLTWQISRSWSVAAHTGTLNGIDLIFQRRFNRLFKRPKHKEKLKEPMA